LEGALNALQERTELDWMALSKPTRKAIEKGMRDAAEHEADRADIKLAFETKCAKRLYPLG